MWASRSGALGTVGIASLPSREMLNRSRVAGQQLRRVIRVGTVVALSIAATGCGGDDATPATTTGAPTASAIPVVIDTDAAIDDLVALTFLLASDEVEVRAITVSHAGLCLFDREKLSSRCASDIN